MKKPEKKELGIQSFSNFQALRHQAIGYNQAIDKYEAYHNWVLSRLPSEEEIRNIIRKELLPIASIINEISTRVGKPKYKPNYEDSRALNLAYKKISLVM